MGRFGRVLRQYQPPEPESGGPVHRLQGAGEDGGAGRQFPTQGPGDRPHLPHVTRLHPTACGLRPGHEIGLAPGPQAE